MPKKGTIKEDVFDLKNACGEAIKIATDVQIMKGVKPVLTSGNHCIAMYLIAYRDNHISKEKAIETIGGLIKNGYATEGMVKKAESELNTKFRG